MDRSKKMKANYYCYRNIGEGIKIKCSNNLFANFTSSEFVPKFKELKFKEWWLLSLVLFINQGCLE